MPSSTRAREGSIKVACFCAIRSLLLDAETSKIKAPSNQGSFRPIDVRSSTPQSTSSSPYFPQTSTKFPRFGISTFARLLAFTTSSLPMSSLRYRMYAVTA